MKKTIFPIMFVLALFLFSVSLAESAVLRIPAETRYIEEEAFCGDISLQVVIIPEGTLTIGPRAFADSSLTQITLPGSLTYIADNALESCENVRVSAAEGTYAYNWAVEHELTILDVLTLTDIASDLNSTMTGEPVHWSVQASGGTEPYSFHWEVHWGDVLEYTITQEEETLEYAPMRIGNYTASVTLIDASGAELQAASEIVSASAHTATNPEDFDYEDLNGVYCKITGYHGTDRSLYLPTHSPSGLIVQSIGDCAFCDKSYFDVVLSDTVETVDYGILEDDPTLRKFVCGQALTSIGDNAFFNCRSLSSFDCSESLRDIGSSAFQYCHSLENISLGGGVRVIGSDAFYHDINLVHVSLNEGLEEIHARAFTDCINLRSIHLPDSITVLDHEVFRGCEKLESVNYPASWAECDASSDWQQYSSPFYYCINLTAMAIPEGVTRVPHGAFVNATSFTEISLPSTLQEIGGEAFFGCTGLTSISLPANTTVVGDGAYANCTGLVRAVLRSVIQIGSEAFSGCTALERVGLPESLTAIYNNAFQDCISLQSIYLPDSITVLGAQAFSGCEKLETVNYPENWTWNWDEEDSYESASPFYDCVSLKSIVIPEGVTRVPEYAFRNAESFTEIVLPSTLQEIGYQAFLECIGLTNIVLPSSLRVLEEEAYKGCINIISLTIEEGLPAIDEEAFAGCAGLTSVSLPNSLLKVAPSAFSDCTSLTSIHLPDSITVLGAQAFSGCEKLETVNYPENWTWNWDEEDSYESASPFCDCVSLKSIVIPEGVTRVPEYAFREANSLVMVCLPFTLRQISYQAFQHCENLVEINIGPNVNSIDDTSFEYHNPDLVIYGENGSTASSYCQSHGITFSTDEMPWPTVQLTSRIIDADMIGISGVAVSLWLNEDMTGQPQTVTTNNFGKWTFSNALCGRVYRITFEKVGYNLTPYSFSYTVKWENCSAETTVVE